MTDREKLTEMIHDAKHECFNISCEDCEFIGQKNCNIKFTGKYMASHGVYISKPCEAMPSKDWKFTNADRIRAMSDEDLAGLLSGMCKIAEQCDDCPMEGICPGGTYSPAEWIKWLNQPAEVDNDKKQKDN